MSLKIFKPNDYKHLETKIVNYVNKKGLSEISELCCLTGIPLVVAYHFVGNNVPELKEDCDLAIDNLNKFYGDR